MRGWLLVGGQFVLLAALVLLAAASSTTEAGRVWGGPVVLADVATTRRVAATILLLVGAVVLVTSARQLGSALTPHPQPLGHATLRTDGWYARVRHPIYSGVLAVGWGSRCGRAGWSLWAVRWR